MKIFINGISAIQGGGVTYLNAFLKHFLNYNGIYIEVWGFSKIDKNLLTNHNLKVNPLENVHENFFKRYYVERFQISKYLKNNFFDIVFFPGGTITSKVPKQSVSVTMFRNMLPFNRAFFQYYGFSFRSLRLFLLKYRFLSSYRKADSIIFISKYAKSIIEERIPLIKNKSVVIPHGFNKNFKIKRERNSDIFFVYISIYTNYKHQKEIVEAAKIFKNKHGYSPKIKMYGYKLGNYKNELIKLVEKYNLLKYIEINGSLEFNEIPKVYSESSYIIFASSCENCPNILLESMATGVPILCSNVMPMPEFLGNKGIYFDPYNPNSISNSFEKVLLKGSNYENYSEYLLKKSKSYSWSLTFEKTYNYFNQLKKNETDYSES